MFNLVTWALLLYAGVLLMGCTRADAMPARESAPTPTLSMSLLPSPPDSLYVNGAWTVKCDAAGCPDSVRITWLVNGAPRAMRSIPAGAAGRYDDVVRFARPFCPDSAVTQLALVTVRRKIVSAGVSGTKVWKCTDRAPLPVDSIVIDTTAAGEAERAFLDTFPTVTIRDSAGYERRTMAFLPGDTVPLCALARNRYTGEVVTLIDPALSDNAANRLETRCATAREVVRVERSG